MFNHWTLVSKHFLPATDNFSSRLVVQTDWITVVFLITLLLVAFVLIYYRRKVWLMIRALYSQRYFSQLLREGKLLNERIYLFILVIIFLTQSLLLCFLLELFFPGTWCHFQPYIWYFIMFGIVMADYLIKIPIVFIFTYLFEYEEERSVYLLNKLFYYTINSLALFPILIIAHYTQIWYILLLYALFFMINFLVMSFRLFTLNLKKINPFHFFIYFCTFEILPYPVMVKVLFLLEKQLF